MDAPPCSHPNPKHNHPSYHTHPQGGVPWKRIAVIMWEDKSCTGGHFNYTDESPRLKFHQDLGCPSLAKLGYILRKDVTASAKVVDLLNNKVPRMTDQALTNKPVAKRVSNDSSSNQVSARRFYSLTQTSIRQPDRKLRRCVSKVPPRAGGYDTMDDCGGGWDGCRAGRPF